MATISHLVCAPLDSSLELDAIARLASRGSGRFRHEVLLVGGVRAEQRLRRSGAPIRGVIRAPAGSALAVSSALRHALASGRRDAAIHAWSSTSAMLAMLARWRGPLITSLEFPSRRCWLGTRVLQKRALGRSTRLLCGSLAELNAWREHVDPIAGFTIVPRPILHASSSEQRRLELRSRWGAGDHLTILTPLETPPRSIDSFLLTYVAGVLHVTQKGMWPLVPRDARTVERGQRFTERHPDSWKLIVEDDEMTEILEGIDVGLFIGSRYGRATDVRLLEVAAARGVPCLALATAAAREIARSAPSVELAESGKTVAIIRSLLGMSDRIRVDRTRKPSDTMARLHDPSRWVDRIEHEYRRALGLAAPLETEPAREAALSA